MAIHLIVREPFGDYAKGDRIEDAKTVDELLAGERAHHVIRVVAPDDEPPASPVEER